MSDIYAILKEEGFEATIGLEVHVQLNTKTKIFSSEANGVALEANAHIGPVSLGLPGSLPVLNEQAVNKAIQFGLAAGSKINEKIFFDRKSYFYPDLPKGYQTTQDSAPICIGGAIEAYLLDSASEMVQLHHTHLEEDAGKSSHDQANVTSIDLNRAGSPLIEIVTEPCIKTGHTAAAFLQEIRRIVRFLSISEANMEKGELRCDANISIKKIEDEQLGKRVEIKNMNSFNHVRRAIDFELERQLNQLKLGKEVVVETRTFDPENGQTLGMRFKETLNDYRYFPCPDLPPTYITSKMVEEVEKEMGNIPLHYRNIFRSQYGVKELDVAFLSEDKETADFAITLIEYVGDAKKAANWIKGPIKAYCNEHNCRFFELPRSAEAIAQLIRLELEGQVTMASAQHIFLEMMISNHDALVIAKTGGWLISKDQDELERIVSEVLLSLPQEVEKYRMGKKQLFGLFMGEIMKRGGKTLNPKQIQEALRKELSK